MFDWRVGLREREGKWYSSSLDCHGAPVLAGVIGYSTPGEAVNQLQKELEDWAAYKNARKLS